jgi:succinylglutamate desuccinylase
MNISSEIVEIASNQPGPTLAIFAGLHGNETAGILALQELIPKLKVTRGKLLLAFANPPAIAANVRSLNKNMNRLFIEGNTGSDPEDERAKELMKALDTCDALLDLHMFHDDAGAPFVICEENALDIARLFDVDVISTNWDKTEPGAADGYMYRQGKIGICVECGPISKAAQYKDLAIRTIFQYLKYFCMTDEKVEYSTKPKRIIKADHTVYKSSEKFVLAKNLHNFEKLEDGQILATDGDKRYIGHSGESIIFPYYQADVGEEAYIIGVDQV